MKDIKSNITINVEITNGELLAKVETICNELSLSLDVFILSSLNKLIADVHFVHELRNIHNDNK